MEVGLHGNEERMLWLDVSEDPALSRICIAPKEIFELPAEYEDERLANGEALKDVFFLVIVCCICGIVDSGTFFRNIFVRYC